MKCAVIYFSQTGNTEKIAQAIREGVKQIAGNCEIIPFMEANPRQLYKYDLIGLGSPIFSFVEPLNVKLFGSCQEFCVKLPSISLRSAGRL